MHPIITHCVMLLYVCAVDSITHGGAFSPKMCGLEPPHVACHKQRQGRLRILYIRYIIFPHTVSFTWYNITHTYVCMYVDLIHALMYTVDIILISITFIIANYYHSNRNRWGWYNKLVKYNMHVHMHTHVSCMSYHMYERVRGMPCPPLRSVCCPFPVLRVLLLCGPCRFTWNNTHDRHTTQ